VNLLAPKKNTYVQKRKLTLLRYIDLAEKVIYIEPSKFDQGFSPDINSLYVLYVVLKEARKALTGLMAELAAVTAYT
jgi:hypothetical protein